MRKLHRGLLLLVVLAAVAFVPQSAQAQSGGGGTFSACGGYELGGSVSQADAYYTHAGGSYALKGGFWVMPLMRAHVPIVRKGT